MAKRKAPEAPRIPEWASANFKTLGRAFDHDQVAVMSTIEKATGKPAFLICAVQVTPGDPLPYTFVPLARMIEGNPYELFTPPTGKEGKKEESTE